MMSVGAALYYLLHRRGQVLVLVGRDEIDARFQRGPPAYHDRIARTEVITVAPSAIIRAGEAIQCVEADPIAEPVRAIDQGVQAPLLCRGPLARFGLPTLLHFPPRVVPPAAVIRRWL